jgi:uncharacterized repeat protein (TIGR01451 family)
MLAMAIPVTASANSPGDTKMMELDGTEITSNDPHLEGCDFTIQWSGFTTLSTVTFSLTGQSPPNSNSGAIVVPPTIVTLTDGFAQLPISFTPENLAGLTLQGNNDYHISLNGDLADSGNSSKNKTFWIEKACGVAKLAIDKSANPTSINVGETSVFTINVWNPGSENLTNATISDTLPAGLSYVSDDEAGCTHSAGTITCTIAQLDLGGSATSKNFDVAVTVRGDEAGTYVNTASVVAGTVGPFTDDATLTVTRVFDGPNTHITKSANPASITQGSQSTFTINVWNSGDQPATGVTISDTLPAGLTYVSDDETDCTFNTGTSILSCAVGTLAAGGSATSGNFDVQVVVLGASAGSYTNIAIVDSNELDPEQAEAALTVVPQQIIIPPDDNGTLIVEKQTLPDGATETFAFSGAVSATLGDGQSSARSVDPGTYTVTEATANGWSLSSITCTDSNTSGQASTGDLASKTATFRVSANETVRCVFTNSEPPAQGRIVVTKQTQPNGSNEAFGFAGALSGSLSDGESLSAEVPAGTYEVAEHAEDGWELTNISCTDSVDSANLSTTNLNERTATMRVDAGETVSCVFTNTETEVLPRPPLKKPDEEILPDQGVLPFTGADPFGLVSFAGLLLTLGGSLVLVNRRKK